MRCARAAFLFLLIIPAILCSAGDKKDYKTDPTTGVRYLFFKQNKKGKRPAMGDVAYIRLVYKTENDSLLFDSHAGRNDSSSIVPITLQKNYSGSLENGISLMAVGDSASFLINADSLYLKIFKLKSIPHYIGEGSDIRFYIKLDSFETQKEIRDKDYALIEKRRTELKTMQIQETATIEKYISDNKVTAKPIVVDSLYLLERTGGNMQKPINEGDSVELKYTGYFLDGSIFDQSDKGDGKKSTIKVLYRYNAQIIKGWLTMLATMHEGEKVRILLPSSLAYGPYGAGKVIKPYTPLLYEIEVVKVSSPFDN